MKISILIIILFLTFPNQASEEATRIDFNGQLRSTLQNLCNNNIKGKILPLALKSDELQNLTRDQIRFLAIQSYNNEECKTKRLCRLHLQLTFIKNNKEKITWAYPLEVEMSPKQNSIKQCHCSFKNYLLCEHK